MEAEESFDTKQPFTPGGFLFVLEDFIAIAEEQHHSFEVVGGREALVRLDQGLESWLAWMVIWAFIGQGLQFGPKFLV